MSCTPSPAIARRDGKWVMPFGTPGNDVQPQAMLQVLLNMFVFDLAPQAAIEQPRFADVLVRELLDGAKHLKSLWKERPELFRQIHYHARKLIENGIDPKGRNACDVGPLAGVAAATAIPIPGEAHPQSFTFTIANTKAPMPPVTSAASPGFGLGAA